MHLFVILHDIIISHKKLELGKGYYSDIQRFHLEIDLR